MGKNKRDKEKRRRNGWQIVKNYWLILASADYMLPNNLMNKSEKCSTIYYRGYKKFFRKFSSAVRTPFARN